MQKEFKKDEILGEFQYYQVTDNNANFNGGIKVNIDCDKSNNVGIGRGYLDSAKIYSADAFSEEKKITATEMSKIFLDNSRLPMTVKYRKKRQESECKAQALNLIMAVKQEETSSAITKKLKLFLKGEERTVRGRHYGKWTANNTRIKMVDMDIERDKSKDYDTRLRQVDPRTIFELIVDDVKYTLK